MESATFGALEAAVLFSVAILYIRTSTNTYFLLTMLVTPPDFPYEPTYPLSWRRVLRTTV